MIASAFLFCGFQTQIYIYMLLDARVPVKDLIFCSEKMKEMEISGGNSIYNQYIYTYNTYMKVDGVL